MMLKKRNMLVAILAVIFCLYGCAGGREPDVAESGPKILLTNEAGAENKEEMPKEQLEQYDSDWTEEKMIDEIRKRRQYLDKCPFCGEVNQYMENVREVRDISVYTEYLFASDQQFYSESDFKEVPPLIIHLAKNEIYARHGYIFKDEDLNYYFCGQLWYLPETDAEEFDDSVFNEYERENIKLLSGLDDYKK